MIIQATPFSIFIVLLTKETSSTFNFPNMLFCIYFRKKIIYVKVLFPLSASSLTLWCKEAKSWHNYSQFSEDASKEERGV